MRSHATTTLWTRQVATGQRDRLYAEALDEVPPFEFNEAVSEVFSDMIRRSVPGYETVVRMTGALVAETYKGEGVIYDLGCSLGEASGRILAACRECQPNLVLVDSSESMLERCRQRFAGEEGVECLCADVNDMHFEPASAFILNYTLQFIPQSDRSRLLERLWQALVPGGVVIVSEKIRLEPPARNAEAVAKHHAFKRLMGYSDREVEQKREALEDVLVPDRLDQLKGRLRSAGFSNVLVWFECLNWVSIAAYKDA